MVRRHGGSQIHVQPASVLHGRDAEEKAKAVQTAIHDQQYSTGKHVTTEVFGAGTGGLEILNGVAGDGLGRGKGNVEGIWFREESDKGERHSKGKPHVDATSNSDIPPSPPPTSNCSRNSVYSNRGIVGYAGIARGYDVRKVVQSRDDSDGSRELLGHYDVRYHEEKYSGWNRDHWYDEHRSGHDSESWRREPESRWYWAESNRISKLDEKRNLYRDQVGRQEYRAARPPHPRECLIHMNRDGAGHRTEDGAGQARRANASTHNSLPDDSGQRQLSRSPTLYSSKSFTAPGHGRKRELDDIHDRIPWRPWTPSPRLSSVSGVDHSPASTSRSTSSHSPRSRSSSPVSPLASVVLRLPVERNSQTGGRITTINSGHISVPFRPWTSNP